MTGTSTGWETRASKIDKILSLKDELPQDTHDSFLPK